MNRHNQERPTEPPAPGTITAIASQQRDGDRMNIHIDGNFAFGLHVDVVLNHRLTNGMDLSVTLIETLLADDEVKKAITAALNLVAFRPRASGELERKLREKGYRPEAAEAAVNRMRDLGYLNDATFANHWIENRQEHRPRSRRMLTQELRQKGIDAEIIKDALGDTEIDEFGDALDLARKKAEGMQGLDVPTRQRRLSGVLSRRGYGFDVIRKVLDEIG